MSQMIEVKTAELEGAALRWAVSLAEGLEVTIHPPAYGNGHRIAVNGRTEAYRPDMDWSQGGPLVDRHTVKLIRHENGSSARIVCDSGVAGESGRTVLEALCRAIVAAKLGGTIAVPAELLP